MIKNELKLRSVKGKRVRLCMLRWAFVMAKFIKVNLAKDERERHWVAICRK